MGKHEVKRTGAGASGVAKRPAVFIDRDGTIIEYVDVLSEPSQIKLLSGAAEAIAKLNQLNFLVIGLTNQPNIEKGLVTMEELEAVHARLREELAESGAHLDAIYTCPHRYRPPTDATGQCECRKPGIKLIREAQTDFAIDMEQSWFIGDRLRDVETGRRAHLKTIFVATGGPSKDDEFFSDAKPDYAVDDLLAAAQLIR
jgi:histidinol-phosphate phosphatase family protein